MGKLAHKKVIFVADTNFIEKKFIDCQELISIFPVSKGDGARRFTAEEILERSKILGNLFEILIPEFSSIWRNFFCVADKGIQDLLRPIIVYPTSVYVDRLLRVEYRVSQQSGSSIRGVNLESPVIFTSLDEFHDSNVNFKINQDLVNRVLCAMGFLDKEKIASNAGNGEYPIIYRIDNKLFGESNKLIKLINKINDFLSHNWVKINNKKFIGAIGLLSNEESFRKKGFLQIGNDLNKIPSLKLHSTIKKNISLRDGLKKGVSAAIFSSFSEALEKLGVSKELIPKLTNEWIKLVIDWIPTNLLENLNSNYERIETNLPINCCAVIGSQLVSEFGLLNCIVGKNRGIKIYGIQHNAGHYGYINDLSIFANFEYSLYDIFVTYGWDYFDRHLPTANVMKLPSPKLSELALNAGPGKMQKIRKEANFDILFMPNLFHRFPHASTSGQTRVDYIDRIFDSHKELINTLVNCGYSILHKPHNQKFVDLYSYYYESLDPCDLSKYTLLRTNQKGLTDALCSMSKIIVWDQVGSGAVECFAARRPTMIYWERIYSVENDSSFKLINNLERVGLIHSTLDSLTRELGVYFENPMLWMNCELRNNAIQEFCNNYARYTQGWDNEWSIFFEDILKG